MKKILLFLLISIFVKTYASEQNMHRLQRNQTIQINRQIKTAILLSILKNPKIVNTISCKVFTNNTKPLKRRRI